MKSKVMHTWLAAIALAASMTCGATAHAQAAASPTNLARKLANPAPMPDPNTYQGLSRKVLQYSEAFDQLVKTGKSRPLTAADWAPIERLVDVDDFRRIGMFLRPQAEVIGWEQYKNYISQYATQSPWEGTLRHITEQPGRVVLGLEERTGGPGAAYTITVYDFNEAGKLRHLEVYVMPVAP